MSPLQLIRYFGGIAGTASALKISEQAVKNYHKSGQVGWLAQQLAQWVSGGKLKAKRPQRKPYPKRKTKC